MGAAAPEIPGALVAANSGTAAGYGHDRWTAELQCRFGELFEAEVAVFPVSTGTAANALALAAAIAAAGIGLEHRSRPHRRPPMPSARRRSS